MQILPYSYRNPKYRFSAFISKMVTPRYIWPRYQMKERKIFYKKRSIWTFHHFEPVSGKSFLKSKKKHFWWFFPLLSLCQGIREMDTNLTSVEFSTKSFRLPFHHNEPFRGKSRLIGQKNVFLPFFQKKTYHETIVTFLLQKSILSHCHVPNIKLWIVN